jgi:hypothetical protein
MTAKLLCNQMVAYASAKYAILCRPVKDII